VENEENASKRRKAKTKGVCDSVTDSWRSSQHLPIDANYLLGASWGEIPTVWCEKKFLSFTWTSFQRLCKFLFHREPAIRRSDRLLFLLAIHTWLFACWCLSFTPSLSTRVACICKISSSSRHCLGHHFCIDFGATTFAPLTLSKSISMMR
jgi:hypothetical protein